MDFINQGIITIEEAVKFHRELWIWVSGSGLRSFGEDKSDWPGWNVIIDMAEKKGCERDRVEDEIDSNSYCFGCMVASSLSPEPINSNQLTTICDCCPFMWSKDSKGRCRCFGNNSEGLYFKFINAKNCNEAEKIAKQIAALPLEPWVINGFRSWSEGWVKDPRFANSYSEWEGIDSER